MNTALSAGSWLAAKIEPASDGGELGRIAALQILSSWYSKPLPVPSPMIGGTLKAIMLASRIAWHLGAQAGDDRVHVLAPGRCAPRTASAAR